MKKLSFLMILSVVFAFSACGKDKKQKVEKTEEKNKVGKVVSCNMPKVMSCKQYGEGNIEAAGMDFLKNLCSSGDFKEIACPTDKKIGSCKTPEGHDFYYEGYPVTVDKLKIYCDEKKGVWSK